MTTHFHFQTEQTPQNNMRMPLVGRFMKAFLKEVVRYCNTLALGFLERFEGGVSD